MAQGCDNLVKNSAITMPTTASQTRVPNPAVWE